MSDLNRDRRYCREVLPHVSRTFAINIRLLPGSMRDAVESAYLLCRTADALEDSWPGPPAEMRERFERLRHAIAGDDRAARSLAEDAGKLEGGRADLELVRHLPAVWRVFQALPAEDREAIAEALRTMTAGMSRYAARSAERGPGVAYLDDEAELMDYCWVVAGCVGVMLTKLHARRAAPASAADFAAQLELSPTVGRALQLTNILLDWPHDVRRGRCYVPGAWLGEYGLAPADLVGTPREELRELEARLERHARAALSRVPEYLALLPARSRRYRLFVLLPALWALRSIGRARRDPEFPWGVHRPKLTRAELWSAGAAALVGGASIEELRRCATMPSLATA